MKYDCILLAGGSGERMGLEYNKVLYPVKGKKELFRYSLDFFIKDQECEKIILVSNHTDMEYFWDHILDKKVKIVEGGHTRSDSVRSGLALVDNEYVLIHDSARPMLYKEDIKKLLDEAIKNGGATLANRVYNTVSQVDEKENIKDYLDRDKLASIITPQAFYSPMLKACYAKYRDQSFSDDTHLFRMNGRSVKVVFSDNLSIKATKQSDLKMLEAILK